MAAEKCAIHLINIYFWFLSDSIIFVRIINVCFHLYIFQVLEDVDYEYPNISEPWIAEDTCRRPQWPHPKDTTPHHRRQRPHHRRQHPHLSEGLQDEADTTSQTDDHRPSADGGIYDGGDVMFDDDINTKPIKRIDADPVRKLDVFMPIREDSFEPKNYGINSPNGGFRGTGMNTMDNSVGGSGRTVNTRNRAPFEDLREEFDAMEQDLEEEVNHNRLPDSFQERTAHKTRGVNIAGRSNPCVTLVLTLTLAVLCCTCVLSRLKHACH